MTNSIHKSLNGIIWMVLITGTLVVPMFAVQRFSTTSAVVFFVIAGWALNGLFCRFAYTTLKAIEAVK